MCVYALVSPSARVSGTGVMGERLRLVVVGRVAAVVGTAAPPRATRQNLVRYDAVVRKIWSGATSVLPARFATCLSDAEELAFILRSRQVSVRHALKHVSHRAQMTVRVIGVAGMESLEPDLEPEPEALSGTQFLRGRAARTMRARHVPGFTPLRMAVERWVRDERVEKRASVATIYHLVPRASAPAYRRALERAASRSTLHVVVSGPWPAYAFGDSWL